MRHYPVRGRGAAWAAIEIPACSLALGCGITRADDTKAATDSIFNYMPTF
jgi:hypothetical protein